MRKIAVVTVARSDYGICRPLLRVLSRDAGVELQLIAAAMHLVPEFGRTADEIERDGFTIAGRVEMLLAGDTPESIAKSMGVGMLGFAQAYARLKPDLLVVLGDRFEMHAAAAAALPFNLPCAHLYGGDLTEGAMDDALRHSITKLSHLHFTSLPESAARIRQMGEEPWRVEVAGLLSLDNIAAVPALTRAELEERCRLSLDPAPVLVTYHPETLEFQLAEQRIDALLAALAEVDRPLVFTAPNADTGGRAIAARIRGFIAGRRGAVLVESLGTQGYFGMMRCAAAMVGNSSSGIMEAPSFELPVVNIGARQHGRVRAANVIDVEPGRDAIAAGVRRALAPEFRGSLRGLANPYGDGHAAERIARRLRTVPLGDRLIRKRFIETAEEPALSLS